MTSTSAVGATLTATLLKWGGVAVLALVAVGSGVRLFVHEHREPVSTPAPAVSMPAPVPSTPADDLPLATAPASELPAPSTMSTTAARSSPSADRKSAGPQSLEPQIAAIDRARSDLASGDAPGCLRDLDAYARDFPHGTFAQEATVLRIQALIASGNKAKAQALGDRFLRANPNGPYARRIRALLSNP
jgi:hypothetical protein